MSALSEDSVILDSRKHAKLALVSLYTRLLTLEYKDINNVLLNRNVPHQQREILSVLNEDARKVFVDYVIGDYQCRTDRLVESSTGTLDPICQVYDRALFAWRAFGTTVLVNTKLTADAVKFDQPLLEAGIRFKRWFFHSCFSKFEFTKKGPLWPGLDKTITLIKRLGAWITYYGSFSSETEKPRPVDALPGAYIDRQELTWFDGTLKEFRRPWLLKPSVDNVHALATMAGFTRALPPASKAVARDAAKDTFRVLTTQPKATTSFALKLFEVATSRVVTRMAKVPQVTHCSINASACYERTTEEGGTASFVVEEVTKLLNMSVDDMVSHMIDIPARMYDPFGRQVFGETIPWVTWARRQCPNFPGLLDPLPTAQGFRRPMVFGHMAYRGEWLDPRVNGGVQWNLPNLSPFGGLSYNREVINLFKDDKAAFYNETLGDIVTLWAFSAALQYGHFVDCQGNTCETVFPNLALFAEPGFKIWVQDKNIPASFMALEEPGWKARCLTKNKAFVVILQALMRHPVAESIGSDGRCGLGLKSSHILWDFLKLIKGKKFDKNWYMVSTDLKAATDLIPHDILNVIWKVALPHMGIDHRHPLFVLKNLVMVSHQLEWDISLSRTLSGQHCCGSFMGEPMSFMGLSLYNLCVGEIAAYSVLNKVDVEYINILDFQNAGPQPADYSAIVGDDRFSLTDLPGMFPAVNKLYRMTNGSPSPGKNTVSRVHGILAENHVFLNPSGELVYLDTIKAKLLTPSTRFHSDNRTSLIGKGATLWQSLEWLDSTCPVPNSAAVENARMLYVIMMTSGFYPKDIRRALKLPIILPASLGGINFPVAFDAAKKYFSSELNLLWWLVTGAPIEVFLEYAMRIRDIASKTKRALASDSFSKIWKDTMSNLVKEQGLTVREKFEPEDQTGLYTLKSVLMHIQEENLPVPISKVTKSPQVNMSVDYVYRHYGYLPIESLIELWERQSTFTKAFTEGVSKRELLSFHKYVGNLERFWQFAGEKLSHVDVGVHAFTSMDDIHWRFTQRMRTFIHQDRCGGGRISSGATLFVRLARHYGVTHTEQGWSDIRDRSVHAYLSRIKSEREEEIPLDGSSAASAANRATLLSF